MGQSRRLCPIPSAMRVIRYNRQIVAFAQGNEIRLKPQIAALDRGHPDRRWAAGLATFACLVESGDEPSPYTPDRACAFARDLLVPTHQFAMLAGLTDGALAACFGVPTEQIPARRAELGLTWN